MIKKIKRLKKIKIHHEGTDTLIYSFIALATISILLWRFIDTKIPFWIFTTIGTIAYLIVLNFYRSPIRYFGEEDTEGIVVAPMNLFNVHANWFPVDGKVKLIRHFDGNFHKAWLPKASEENERADVLITTPDGQDILCRQIAGAMARRIVTYAREGEDCYIDEHLGFIKLGSRVDLYLPVGSEICVKMGQKTTGNQTVIAKLKS